MTRILSSIAASALLAMAVPAQADPARYETLQDAVDALVQGVRDQDRAGLLTVFGPEAEGLIYSGDPAEDRANRTRLGLLYREGWRLVPNDDGSVTLALGRDEWPFPIPLVLADGAWAFDIVAGEAEMVAREIGANELDVIDLLDAYGDVQAVFRLVDHDGDGVMEFARYIISDDTRRDGLFWGDGDSPMGVRLARAALDGYADDDGDQPPVPHSGYYFRILDAQSENAPGGQMDYLVNDNMVGGHALLAVPAIYGETGIMSFMVSENGIILEADLGEDTLELAIGMMTYDPGAEWAPVED